MRFEHVAPLAGHDAIGAKVHLLAPNGQGGLCGRVDAYRISRGVRVQILYPIDEPANCAGCLKALEMVVRNDLRFLNLPQLEEVAEITNKLRGNWH